MIVGSLQLSYTFCPSNPPDNPYHCTTPKLYNYDTHFIFLTNIRQFKSIKSVKTPKYTFVTDMHVNCNGTMLLFLNWKIYLYDNNSKL